MEKRSSNGQIQIDCHSSTTRNCRNHSTVQYGRTDTTRTSSLYLQTFRMCEKSVLDPIPRTQHRPICVTVHPVIVPQPTPFRKKLNGAISQRIGNTIRIVQDTALPLSMSTRNTPSQRPKIPGMTLVAERRHNKHGSSVFVRDGLKVNSISVCEEEKVEFITVELPGVVVHSLYKLPPEPFLLPPLGQRIKPHIVIGDFNSNSTLWGYTTTDSDGKAVEQRADSNRLSLIHNAKPPKSFNSAIWKKGYNPDLIFVSSNILDMWEKSVLDPIPRTQHRLRPYLCDCPPSYCTTTYSIQKTL